MPAPTKYDGSKEKLLIFMKEMKAWLEDNKVMEEVKKTRLTLAFMKKDKVAVWSTQVVEDEMMWKTYSEFLDTIKICFGNLSRLGLSKLIVPSLGNMQRRLDSQMRT